MERLTLEEAINHEKMMAQRKRWNGKFTKVSLGNEEIQRLRRTGLACEISVSYWHNCMGYIWHGYSKKRGKKIMNSRYWKRLLIR